MLVGSSPSVALAAGVGAAAADEVMVRRAVGGGSWCVIAELVRDWWW
jgi:hypothetical protein